MVQTIDDHNKANSLNSSNGASVTGGRAALYARVSTDDQRDRHTIDGQITALQGFAPHGA